MNNVKVNVISWSVNRIDVTTYSSPKFIKNDIDVMFILNDCFECKCQLKYKESLDSEEALEKAIIKKLLN